MRDVIKKILSALLLCCSAGFLLAGIIDKAMDISGIAKVKLNLSLPSLKMERDLPDIGQLTGITIPTITQLPDIPELSAIPTAKVESIASNIASRVSDGLSQATSAVGSLLDKAPQEITVGTLQVCYMAMDNKTDCAYLSSDPSTWFPSSVSSLLDLSSITSPMAKAFKINIHSCLIAALVGVLLLIVFTCIFGIIDVTSGILNLIFGKKVLIDVAGALLIFIPLGLASVMTFWIPSLFRKMDALFVEDGGLKWRLGVAIGMAMLGIGVQYV
jgi:hypothetical protein